MNNYLKKKTSEMNVSHIGDHFDYKIIAVAHKMAKIISISDFRNNFLFSSGNFFFRAIHFVRNDESLIELEGLVG